MHPFLRAQDPKMPQEVFKINDFTTNTPFEQLTHDLSQIL